MHFTRIILENIGPHAFLDLELQRGLIGVFGKNGSGKSTLVDSMYTALTGDFSRFTGLKTDLISNKVEHGTHSRITAEIVHYGRRIKIQRNLYPASPASVLWVDDADMITNSNKITEQLSELLGIDASMLNLFVFKKQDQIYDFLTAIDSVRKKSFQVLCKTQNCADIEKVIAERVKQESAKLGDVNDDSDQIRTEMLDLDNRSVALGEERNKQSLLLLNSASFKTANEIIYTAKKAAEFANTVSRLKAEQANAASALAQAKKVDLSANDSAQESQRTTITELKEQLEILNRAIERRAQYERDLASRKRLEAADEKLKSLTLQLQQYEWPQELALYVASLKELNADTADDLEFVYTTDINEAHTQITKHDERLRAIQKILSTLKCPTCGTLTTKLDQAKIEEMRKEAESLRTQLIPQCKQAYNSLKANLEALKQVRDCYNNIKQQLSLAEGQVRSLESYREIKLTADSHLTAAQQQQAATRLTQQIEQAERDLARLVLLKQKAERDLHTAQVAVDSLNSQMQNLVAQNIVPPAEAKLKQATERMAQHTAAVKDIAAIDGRLAEIKESHASLQRRLEQLQARARRLARQQELVALLTQAQDVFHYSRLPAKVANANLVSMCADINQVLDSFGSPFWVETNQDLEFLVHKPGEPVQNARRLSSGQKVVLAVSFWLSVASLWKTDIGFLSLDEPTASLDEANRQFLAEALNGLASRVRDERQIVVITHDDNLRTSFDQVIDIGVA